MVARAIWRDTPKGSRKNDASPWQSAIYATRHRKSTPEIISLCFCFLLDLVLLVVNFIDKIPMIKIPQQYARCCIWLQVTIRHSHYSVLP